MRKIDEGLKISLNSPNYQLILQIRKLEPREVTPSEFHEGRSLSCILKDNSSSLHPLNVYCGPETV